MSVVHRHGKFTIGNIMSKDPILQIVFFNKKQELWSISVILLFESEHAVYSECLKPLSDNISVSTLFQIEPILFIFILRLKLGIYG